jgi:L-seryl-tRNA(Ser) seleniumtransferase
VETNFWVGLKRGSSSVAQYLIRKINRNPIKRALRVDKLTISALSAVLKLYLNPDRLKERLPTLRLIGRPVATIRGAAERIQTHVASKLEGVASAKVIDCESQIGSGALPTQKIPSVGLAIHPSSGKKASGTALERLASAFRSLPVPVIGRLQDGAFILDFRCLEDEAVFAAQLADLVVK